MKKIIFTILIAIVLSLVPFGQTKGQENGQQVHPQTQSATPDTWLRPNQTMFGASKAWVKLPLSETETDALTKAELGIASKHKEVNALSEKLSSVRYRFKRTKFKTELKRLRIELLAARLDLAKEQKNGYEAEKDRVFSAIVCAHGFQTSQAKFNPSDKTQILVWSPKTMNEINNQKR
jgi:hypothetical protein